MEVAEPYAPPVDVAYAFDAAFEIVGRVVPTRLVRRPMRRVLTRKARYEVEKNPSRLAAGRRDRVAAKIRELTVQAEQRAQKELTALEGMVASGSSRLWSPSVSKHAVIRSGFARAGGPSNRQARGLPHGRRARPARH